MKRKVLAIAGLALLTTCGVLLLVEATDVQVAADLFERAPCTGSCGLGGGLGTNWQALNPSLGTTDGLGYAGSPISGSAYLTSFSLWNGAGSFADDQYAAAVPIQTLENQYTDGVVVRANPGTDSGGGYLCAVDGNDYGSEAYLLLYVIDAGGGFNQSGALDVGAVDPATVRISAQSNTITCSATASGVPYQIQITDTTWTSGRVGMFGDNNAFGKLSNWSAGNIVGGRHARSGSTWTNLLVPTVYAQSPQYLYLMPWIGAGTRHDPRRPKYCTGNWQAVDADTLALCLCPVSITASDAVPVPLDATIDSQSTGVAACSSQTWRQCIHSLTGISGTIKIGGFAL